MYDIIEYVRDRQENQNPQKKDFIEIEYNKKLEKLKGHKEDFKTNNNDFFHKGKFNVAFILAMESE